MTKVLRSLKWASGQNNPAGIKTRFFYADKEDIAKWPVIPSSATTAKEEVTYDGDFTMVKDKHFVELYSTQGFGTLSFEGLGEKDGKMVNNKGTFLFPDLNDDAIAFVNRNMNSNGIILAAYFVGGGEVKWVVLGGDHYDITLDIKGETGAKAGDQKKMEIEVTAPDAFALPRYEGVITLEDGVYDCKANTFTEKGSGGGQG